MITPPYRKPLWLLLIAFLFAYSSLFPLKAEASFNPLSMLSSAWQRIYCIFSSCPQEEDLSLELPKPSLSPEATPLESNPQETPVSTPLSSPTPLPSPKQADLVIKPSTPTEDTLAYINQRIDELNSYLSSSNSSILNKLSRQLDKTGDNTRDNLEESLTDLSEATNLTTLGTITTGVWNAGDVTTSGVLTSNGAGNNYFAGRVGIGTTSPTEVLEVNGNIRLSSMLINKNNVKYFGAEGDGVTDDSAAIQRAIDEIPDGEYIYFPAGIYIIGTQINVNTRTNLTIYGDGNSVLKAKPSVDIDNIMYIYNSTGVIMRDIKFDGNYENRGLSTSKRRSITYQNNDKGLFENIWARGSYEGHIIEHMGSTNTVFDNVKIYETAPGSAGHGLDIERSGSNLSANIIIKNSYFWGIVGSEKFENVDGMKFINNYITGVSTSTFGLSFGETPGETVYAQSSWLIEGNHISNSLGISIVNTPTNELDVKIVNNYIEGKIATNGNSLLKKLEISGNNINSLSQTGYSSIELNAPVVTGTYAIIRDNTIHNSPATANKAAIFVDKGWTGVEITNNTIIDPGFTGIISKSDNATISGNLIRASSVTTNAYGIYLYGSGAVINGVSITNNKIYNMDRGIGIEGATNTTISGNQINSDSQITNANAIWEKANGIYTSDNNKIVDNYIYNRGVSNRIVQNSGQGANTTLKDGLNIIIGNLGIGTTSPYAKLSVAGNVVADYFHATSSTATSTFAGGLSVAGTSGLTVLQNGNVGIGTIKPNQRLEVFGNASTTNLVIAPTSTSTAGVLSGVIYQGDKPIFSTYYDPTSPVTNRHNLFFGPDVGNFTLRYDSNVDTNSGGHNVAFGIESLMSNTTGYANNAFGYTTLKNNTTGYHNAAFGDDALQQNISGYYNTAVGIISLYSNVSGKQNTAIGHGSLLTSTGDFNTAVGTYALRLLSAGNRNTAVGDYALYNALGSNNTAVGQDALYTTTGTGNVAIGTFAGFYSTGSNELYIDNATRANEVDEQGKALVYGKFDALVANQLLRVNGNLQISGTGNSYFTSNVGIGTTSPYAKLSVAGSAGGTTHLFAISSSTAGYSTSTPFIIDSNGLLTINTPSATSTINGNLYVNGTTRSTLSYVGDLIFANDFAFTEAPQDADPQSLYLKNQKGDSIFNIDDKGNLKILGDICSGLNCFDKTLTKLSADIAALANITEDDQDITFSGLNQRIDILESNLSTTTLDLENRVLTLEALSSTTASTTALSLSSSPSFLESLALSVFNLIESLGELTLNTLTAARGVFTHIESDSVTSQTIQSNTINTNELCLDDICIDKDQLKALLIQAGGKSVTESVSQNIEDNNENNQDNTETENSDTSTTTPTVSEDDTATSTEPLLQTENLSESDNNESGQNTEPIESDPSPEPTPEPSPSSQTANNQQSEPSTESNSNPSEPSSLNSEAEPQPEPSSDTSQSEEAPDDSSLTTE